MVGIVDYGMGNLLSVYHALQAVGANVGICRHPEEINKVERLVLPGVGAFRDCLRQLQSRGFVGPLEHAVRGQARPLLGICLGMQVLARRSFEGGEHPGLGWVAADVVRLVPNDPALRVPQIGWNDIRYRLDSPLFQGLPPSPDLYFVHSYCLQCDQEVEVEATCDYGGSVVAAIRHGNILATQFHPEKSQELGLKILENFLRWQPHA